MVAAIVNKIKAACLLAIHIVPHRLKPILANKQLTKLYRYAYHCFHATQTCPLDYIVYLRPFPRLNKTYFAGIIFVCVHVIHKRMIHSHTWSCNNDSRIVLELGDYIGSQCVSCGHSQAIQTKVRYNGYLKLVISWSTWDPVITVAKTRRIV